MAGIAVAQDRLQGITVRFTTGAYSVISEVSKENDVSIAEVVRACVDKRLDSYLSKIKYIDEEQGNDILSTLRIVFTEMEEIKMELNRIGVNYNQAIKIKNIEQKYGKGTMYADVEIRRLKRNTELLSEDKINALLNRYDDISKRLGEQLCHIQE